MRKYRLNESEESKNKRNATRRRYWKNVLSVNPEFVLKQNESTARANRKRRKNNHESRKLEYKKHTEWARKNRDYVNGKQRERNVTDKYRKLSKTRWLKQQYGLTYPQYLEIVEAQKGKCAICDVSIEVDGKMSAKKAVVDHDHSTDRVRSILCSVCNISLGFIENNRHLVGPMIKYLDSWKRKHSEG